jgi:glycosyltransferase involved in cell wall biosynthesis
MPNQQFGLERPTVVSAQRLTSNADAAELVVHAVAQMPDNIVADLPSGHPRTPLLKLLARAYGIEERVRFRTTSVNSERQKQEILTAELLQLPFGEAIEVLSNSAVPAATVRGDDRVLAGQRVVVVTNVPTHYRAPLFTTMATRLDAVDAELRVFFLADVPEARNWMRSEELSFEHEFLRGVDLSRDRGRRRLPLNLERRLDEFRPTILLVGGFSPVVALRVALYGLRRGVPFGLWSGEIANRGTAHSRVRRTQRLWLARHASFAISYGSMSAGYLRTLRPDLPIVIGRNTAPFASRERGPREPETIELLAVSRVEPGKGLEVLIDAMRVVDHLPCRLTVVGDGSELSRLVRRANGRVRFLGALPAKSALACYAEADIFLFPSRYDIFGLVLVEAMGTGVAAVVGTEPGAVADLACDSRNCLVVERQTPDAWAEAIARLVKDPELRQAVGDRGRQTITGRWTLAHAADAMIAGLRLPLLQRQPH